MLERLAAGKLLVHSLLLLQLRRLVSRKAREDEPTDGQPGTGRTHGQQQLTHRYNGPTTGQWISGRNNQSRTHRR